MDVPAHADRAHVAAQGDVGRHQRIGLAHREDCTAPFVVFTIDSVEPHWHCYDMATDSLSPVSLLASFAPWRNLHVSQAEIRARLASVRDLEAKGQHDEAIARAEATLEHAPFDAELVLWLVRTYAARGDAAAHRAHLATAFYVDVLDHDAALADASLRGTLSAEAFADNVREASAVIGKDRTRDFWFTEVEPRRDEHGTILHWRHENAEPVLAALRRFCADTARVDRVMDPESEWHDDYLWWIEARVGDGIRLDLEGETAPGFCHLGRVVVLLEELAPFVDDVRLLLYDQTSPLYEVWIVEHAFYLRRHAIYAQDQMWEHLDSLMQKENIRDRPLEELLVNRFSREAAGWLEGMSATYMDADECRQRAEALLARAARLGGAAPEVLAKRELLAGDDEQAVETLERVVQQDAASNPARLELIDIYLARNRFADALGILERTQGAGRHRWGIAYEGAGMRDEARAAYAAHANDMRNGSSGVLLRQAHELFDRGWIESAHDYYAALATTMEFSTPIRAELGLALCAERRGAAAEAATHYERVLARAPAQRRKYKDTPSIVAAIEHCEHVAVRWRDTR